MEIDRNGLNEQFNIDDLETEATELTQINADDPEETIKYNIERTDRILNILEDELSRGNITARLMEVASALINSITAASKELIGNTNYKKYLQIKEQMLEYKYRELEWKKEKKEKPTNQNIIVASREDILKIIGNERKQIENKEGN